MKTPVSFKPTIDTAQRATKPIGNLFLIDHKIKQLLYLRLIYLEYSKEVTKKQQKVTKLLRNF